MFTAEPTNERQGGFPKNKGRTLHDTLKWVLVVCQVFGLMPVMGVTGKDPRFLKFSWRAFRTIYSVSSVIGSAFISIFYLCRYMQNGADLFQYSTIAFHVSTFLVVLFFIQLSRGWPELMRKWAAVENCMRGYGSPPYLHARIAVMSSAVLLIASIEFLLTIISKLLLAIRCKKDEVDLGEYFFTATMYPEIFQVFGYTLWKAVLLQIENVLLTFAWTFNDLFIMIISTPIALRFKQITARLKVMKEKVKIPDVRTWREIREDYNRLSIFTRELDEALSNIILISFASNLFFILLQLFHSLREMNDSLEKAYFFFSFAFLILRTVFVAMYGAWIYDESKEPMAVLNSVSSDVYNIEVKRFAEQIKFDTVALTGKHFFNVTRGLILSMAGAIVTYELVLLQFHENLLKKSGVEAKNATKAC